MYATLYKNVFLLHSSAIRLLTGKSRWLGSNLYESPKCMRLWQNFWNKVSIWNYSNHSLYQSAHQLWQISSFKIIQRIKSRPSQTRLGNSASFATMLPNSQISSGDLIGNNRKFPSKVKKFIRSHLMGLLWSSKSNIFKNLHTSQAFCFPTHLKMADWFKQRKQCNSEALLPFSFNLRLKPAWGLIFLDSKME